MKRALLLSFFIICGVGVYAQSNSKISKSQKLESLNLQIFPNPVTTSFEITYNEVETTGVNTISIFNLVGRKLKSFDANNGSKYYIGDLPKGMYLVQLLGQKNKIITTRRLSKR